MSTATTEWPPQLKAWVAKCLQQMNDANRAEAQAELKQMIAAAYTNKTMWTIDWDTVELESLKPKSFTKRKYSDHHPSPPPASQKKVKKSPMAASIAETNDRLAKRAQRFEREHEIERQKQSGLYVRNQEYSKSINQPQPVGGPSSLVNRMSALTTSTNSTPGNVFKKATSRKKFMNSASAYEDDAGNDQAQNVVDWDRYTIVGTSQSLFKNYLRLTSEPDPRDIRPLPVLEQTLQELKRRWKRDNDYKWTCDQFKSLRQDLTVQRIKNEFTVLVYEIHARMALEAADLVEYNQCQSALRHLYELGIPGKVEEFMAYRILYLLHTRNRSDLNRLISTLSPQVKAAPCVKHAIDVQKAMATNNYHALFVLFNEAPNMGAYVMDHFVERERVAALCIMTKAYMTLPLSFITTELAFESVEATDQFLKKCKAATYSQPKAIVGSGAIRPSSVPLSEQQLDCKAAHRPLTELMETKYRRVTIAGTI